VFFSCFFRFESLSFENFRCIAVLGRGHFGKVSFFSYEIVTSVNVAYEIVTSVNVPYEIVTSVNVPYEIVTSVNVPCFL